MGFQFPQKNSSKSYENFKYLDDLIHSGVKKIVLDSDIILNENEESKYLNGIKLNVNDIVIEGNGHTIDACGKTRIFECMGKNISIKNLVLKNAYGGFGGAIIITGGDLSIFDSEFSNNFAEGFYGGGAILNFGAKLSITDSKFTKNASSKHGGAILNAGGQLSVTKSVFEQNSVKNSGGAVNNDGGDSTITDSSFSENDSEYGGALNNSGNLTISGSSFFRNFSKFGGALSNDDGNLTIDDSHFIGNCSKYGGSLNNDGGNLTISDSTISNSSSEEAGVINHKEGDFKIFNCEILENQSENNIIINKDSLQINNTNFRLNQSQYIIVNDEMAKIGIFNGEFVKNNVKNSILINKGKSCAIEKTLFENNISKSDSKNIINHRDLTLINPKITDDGISILNEGYIVVKDSPDGLDGKITGNGEVVISGTVPEGPRFDFGYLDKLIHEKRAKKIILEHDICLENYERDFFEGGIDLDVDNLVIDGNGKTIEGAGKSRIFIVTGKGITLKNITFKSGRSHQNYGNPLNNDGGALKVNHNAELSIEHCEFINNVSEESGGAIKTMGDLTIIESTLTENEATMFGGAIYNYDGKLKIKHSTFTKNTANMYGGAIDNDISLLSITNSTLCENFSEYGGAIRNYDAKFIMRSCKLINNRAAYGAAINHREGDFKVCDCKFLNNNSDNSIILNRGLMYLNNVHFKDNKSKYAIFNDEEIFDLSILNGKFIESNVDESILCNYGKSCTIEKTVFENSCHNSRNIVNFTDLTLTNSKMRNGEKTILNEGNMLIKGMPETIENKIEGDGKVTIAEVNNNLLN